MKNSRLKALFDTIKNVMGVIFKGSTNLFKKVVTFSSITSLFIAATAVNNANAADGAIATGEVVQGANVTATDTNGILMDANGAGAIAVGIDSNANITIGKTNSSDAITASSTGAAAITITVTDSDTGAASTVTFAGDIVQEDNDDDDSLIISVTNTNIVIGNNVTMNDTDTTMAFTMGSTGDATITVDHSLNEAQTIVGTIDGNATNTATLIVTESTSGANATTFQSAIGATTALDAININTTDDQTASVVFEAAVSATAITLGEASSSTSDATSVTFEAQAAAIAITGTINNAVAADETAIHVTDTTASNQAQIITFASNIGSSIAVDALTIGSATEAGNAVFSGDVSATVLTLLAGDHASEDSIATFKGDVTAPSIVLNEATGQATMIVGGTAAQTITGAITTADDDKSELEITNAAGAVTFTGAIGSEAVRMLEVDVVDSGDVTFQGVIHAKTLDINNNAAGEIVQFDIAGHVIGSDGGNAGVLDFAGGEIKFGTAIAAGDTIFNTAETVGGATGVVIATTGVNLTMPVNFTTGAITFIDGDASSISATELADVFAYNNVLTTNTVTGTTADVTVTATAKSEASIESALSTTNAVARSLRQTVAAAATDSGLMTALQSALVKNTGGDGTADTQALAQQMAPQSDGSSASAKAAQSVTGSVQGIMSNRMASLRSGETFVSGASAGNALSANSGFLQVFGSESKQDNTSKAGVITYGAETETSGIAIGFDGMSESGSVFGLSFSMSESEVVGKGDGKAKSDIDSYTASLYMDKATDSGYIEGSLTYGINSTDGTRLVNTGGLNRSYKSAYDSEQISLRLGGGVPSEVGAGTFLTPYTSLTASMIMTDTYTETSNTASDALRLKVAQDDVNSLIGTVGMKIHKVTDYGTPMISLAINSELGDTKINSTNTYQGGGTAFKTSTEVEELSGTLGLGYTYGSDLVSLDIGYEAEADDNDYLSHYGSVKIVSKF